MPDVSIRLSLNRAEHWLQVLPGVRLRVRPMGSALFLSARADDAVLAAAGADAGAYTAALAIAVAQRAVLGWEGVGDEAGAPLPVTPEGVAALLDQHRGAFDGFMAGYLNPWLAVVAEGNG